MKTLNTYITEWKANTNTVSSIEKKNIQYFVYKLTTNKRLKIFDRDWPQLKDYKNKVYVNGEHVELGDDGCLYRYIKDSNYSKEYKVYIEDIDDIRNCRYMFYDCEALISVPNFDTKNVKDMNSMFANCLNLLNVPLFDTSKVKYMDGMFCYCNNLSDETKKEWSKVYNFETNRQKI